MTDICNHPKARFFRKLKPVRECRCEFMIIVEDSETPEDEPGWIWQSHHESRHTLYNAATTANRYVKYGWFKEINRNEFLAETL